VTKSVTEISDRIYEQINDRNQWPNLWPNQ